MYKAVDIVKLYLVDVKVKYHISMPKKAVNIVKGMNLPSSENYKLQRRRINSLVSLNVKK